MLLKIQVSWNVSWSLSKMFLTFWRVIVPSTSASRSRRIAMWDKHYVLMAWATPFLSPPLITSINSFQSHRPFFNHLFLTVTHSVSLLMHYIPDALVNTPWCYKCQGKHSLTSDLSCASVQCPSNSPHIIASFVTLPMPLPVITTCTVITLWSTITHITYVYTHTICPVWLLILKCVPLTMKDHRYFKMLGTAEWQATLLPKTYICLQYGSHTHNHLTNLIVN